MIDPYLKQIVDDAIAQADASAADCDRYIAQLNEREIVQRSASERNLVFKTNEDAKVEPDLQPSSKSETEAPPAWNDWRDASVAAKWEDVFENVFRYPIAQAMADFVKGSLAVEKLRGQITDLKREIDELREQSEAKTVNVMPLRGRDVA